MRVMVVFEAVYFILCFLLPRVLTIVYVRVYSAPTDSNIFAGYAAAGAALLIFYGIYLTTEERSKKDD